MATDPPELSKRHSPPKTLQYIVCVHQATAAPTCPSNALLSLFVQLFSPRQPKSLADKSYWHIQSAAIASSSPEGDNRHPGPLPPAKPRPDSIPGTSPSRHSRTKPKPSSPSRTCPFSSSIPAAPSPLRVVLTKPPGAMVLSLGHPASCLLAALLPSAAALDLLLVPLGILCVSSITTFPAKLRPARSRVCPCHAPIGASIFRVQFSANNMFPFRL
ncbi:hypothetical protein DFH06DRAFT_1258886 [Mycena polygramma]|nr:hypothetical protein DFH06DRAFT_1258886 [Mycena polygramma]